jgi:hypothetical protein
MALPPESQRSARLNNLNEQISGWYEQALYCARQADEQTDPKGFRAEIAGLSDALVRVALFPQQLHASGFRNPWP